MNPINTPYDAIIAMMKSKGSITNLNPETPPAIKQAFIEMLLECPDCRDFIMGDHHGKEN
jgi:hypothetical protein